MHLITAYISVIIIWATTPLAIKWSSESVGFLFGISSRFLLGAVFALGLILLLGKKLSLETKAIQTYLTGGIGLSSAMLCVYWGAQYIPSGWVSIIFGITPIITGLLAMKLLGESGLTFFRLIAIALGIAGLFAMLETGIHFDPQSRYGIIGVLFSSLFYSLTTVLIKRIDADIDSFSSVTGTLLIAAIFVSLFWGVFAEEIPVEIPARAALSILYLAIVGSVIGFLLFYYVLKRVEATRTSLITLITPIGALLIGHLTNNEPLDWEIIMGCVLILSGLLLFEFEGAIRHTRIIKRV
ncbi:MAG: DMT family transporter [Proteobacteria bacterium]|nr:DMT family transporter [Pseudomonadota bacterium]